MAEIRRPGPPAGRPLGGPQGRPPSGAGSRQGAASRSAVRRPQGKSPPKWFVIVVIAVPLAGIAGLGAYKFTRPAEPPPKEKVVKKDPNDRIRELEAEIPKMQNEGRQIAKLFLEESPQAKSKKDALQKRIKKWQDDWSRLFDEQKDKDGKLLPGVETYRSKASGRVGQILSDLVRNSGL